MKLSMATSTLTSYLEENALKVRDTLVSLDLTAPQGHAPMYNPLDPPKIGSFLFRYRMTK